MKALLWKLKTCVTINLVKFLSYFPSQWSSLLKHTQFCSISAPLRLQIFGWRTRKYEQQAQNFSGDEKWYTINHCLHCWIYYLDIYLFHDVTFRYMRHQRYGSTAMKIAGSLWIHIKIFDLWLWCFGVLAKTFYLLSSYEAI